MLDLVHVRSFVEVAERGTIVAAATSLGYTAPAVSQHVAKLEKELGVALFERQRKRLALSGHGRALLATALHLLDGERRAREAVLGHSGRPRVVIAGFASAIGLVVVPRLGSLSGRFALEVVELEDEPAMRELRLGGVDVVLTQDYDGSHGSRRPDHRHVPVLHDQLRLVLPAGRDPGATIGQFDGASWILNGTDTRCARATRAILDRAGLRYQVAGVVDDTHTVLALVAAGHGLTIMPELVAGDRPDVTVAAQDLGVARTILALTRPEPSPPAAELVELLVEPVPPGP